MQMFNSDGTPGEMCGNGLRCLTKWALDAGWSEGRSRFLIESAVGMHEVAVLRDEGKTSWVEVSLGAPRWEAERIPVLPDRTERTPEVHVDFEGQRYVGYAVSFGNPHVVFFLPPETTPQMLADFPLERFGPLVERDRRFPARVNVEVAVLEGAQTHQRTWERGSGETWACGSGACAIASVAQRLGLRSGPMTLALRGGRLEVEPGDRTLLRGPATFVCRGEWYVWEI